MYRNCKEKKARSIEARKVEESYTKENRRKLISKVVKDFKLRCQELPEYTRGVCQRFRFRKQVVKYITEADKPYRYICL